MRGRAEGRAAELVVMKRGVASEEEGVAQRRQSNRRLLDFEVEDVLQEEGEAMMSEKKKKDLKLDPHIMQ